jgi:hypothetical protein
MSEAVIVALITGACGILAQWLIGSRNRSDQRAQLEKHQAVTDTKLEELTREVRRHNNFAERVPVLEEQIRVANHRLADLEKGARP